MRRALPPGSTPAAWLALVAYFLLTPLVAISVRYLTRHFDTYSLTFYRYAAGAVALAVISPFLVRSHLREDLRSGRLWLLLVGMAVFTVGGQYMTVVGLRYVPAALAVLIGIAGMPLRLVLALAVFRDERAVASPRRLLVGMVLALAGTLGVAFHKLAAGGESLRPEDTAYLLGCVLILGSTLIVSVEALVIKHMATRAAHPMSLAAMSAVVSTVAALAPAVFLGELSSPFDGPKWPLFILFASGVYGVLIGGVLHFVAVRRAGLVRLNFTVLCIPVSTAVLGYLLLGDSLTLRQIGLGLVTIAGCLAAIYPMTKKTGAEI